MKAHRAHLTAYLFLLTIAWPTAAYSAVTPGQEQERFRDETRERAASESLTRQPVDAVLETGAPSETPEEESQTEAEFQIDRIVVTGATAQDVPQNEIRSIVEPHEGKRLTLSDAKTIAQTITNLYRAKGYLTSRAYIPPQDVQSKTLEIRVFEGRLGEVQVRGNRFFRSERIRSYLEPLRRGPLRFDALKAQLSRLNLHPDRQVKAVVTPGQQLGASDLLLDVEDRFPIHIGADVNNFGTEQTGRERYGVTLRHDNLLGVDDSLAARGQFGEEVWALGLQHTLPVGPYGTETGWTFNYTDVNVAGDFRPLDIGGRAWSAGAFVNQPLFDGERLDLVWTGGFESKSIENTILGIQASRDELRLLHTGLNADLLDPWGRTYLTQELTWGVPWLGASERNDPRLSRGGSGASFFTYTAAANRIHPVVDRTYLFLKGSAQVSADPLVSAQQYNIGGAYSVRGYPQSDYLGDGGVGSGAELRVPWYFLPREYKLPRTDVPLWERVFFVGFVDAAYARLRRPAAGESESRTYIGAGGGVRIELPKNFLARLEWAAPIGNEPADGSNSQFYFTVSMDLL